MVRPWPSCWLPTRTLPPLPQWLAVRTQRSPMTEPEQKLPPTLTWAAHGAPPAGTVEPPMMYGVTGDSLAWASTAVAMPDTTSVAPTATLKILRRITAPYLGLWARRRR